MGKFSKRKNVITTYLSISLFLLVLSCIGLFFNEWVIIVDVLICAIFGLFNLLLLISSEEDITSDGPKSSFAIHSFLRYVLMGIGFALSALLVYLTMGKDANNIRYIMVVFAALPYFGTTISYLISAK